MSSSRRFLARCSAFLGLVLLLPACQNTQTGGSGNSNGIFWNSQSSAGAGQGGGGGSFWIDPNLGIVNPIGISNIITSVDDATYASFTLPGALGTLGSPTVVYIMGLEHPLSTDTGSIAITSREGTLQGLINGYRQTQLGNVVIDPGIIGGFPQGIILAGHSKGQKCARAHCKHSALFHGGPPPPGPNAEGDDLLTTVAGSPADTQGIPPTLNPLGQLGRLGKIGVTATQGTQLCYSGMQYAEAQEVFNQLLIDAPGALLGNWTNFAVGHWRGGPEGYSWNILFLASPNPPN